MKKLTTEEVKEVISITFDKNFDEIISRKFAENNYAKFLFIKYCRDKGMPFSVISRHLSISDVAAGRYMREYHPDIYVQELFESRFYSELDKKIKAKITI